MTNYQETLPSNPLVNELLVETASINHVEVIENVIDSLEQDDSAMVSHNSDGNFLWKFKYGSVEVFVQLSGTSDEDTITVWSVVLKLPAKDEPRLLRHLLEMNCTSTLEARFGIIDNQVVVISTRTLAELSPGEVSRVITIVATIADNNDEALQSEFGAA
ncbi:YbjN domain-containing protein [Nostoc sp. 106C]|uniref:YbjN domain-containing protein n=1 Tax=Nostoc sp. 106C TaxID=1932667 RepID=UPI000A3C1D9D|nr:YbjN domain-containing protein [Nostoc sp. 106C]OUL21073.1 YbjN domain-containing protein [Nostoc sp. RF31YmG]OUL28236.1 YbjN domain-containing protein [Nostoc sp. 106C]